MNKGVIWLALIFLIPVTLMGQSKKLFTYQSLSTVMLSGPSTIVPNYHEIDNKDGTFDIEPTGTYQSYKLHGYGGEFAYKIRYNMVEFSQNSSISLAVAPTLGVTIFEASDDDVLGVGHFSIPVSLEFNFGYNATYSHTKNNGGFIGIGIDNIIAPLYIDKKFIETEPVYANTEEYSYSRFYALPTLKIGYRFVGRKGNHGEYSLNLGVGKKQTHMDHMNELVNERPYIIGFTVISNLIVDKIKKKNVRNEDLEF